jgi:hypothetical protein
VKSAPGSEKVSDRMKWLQDQAAKPSSPVKKTEVQETGSMGVKDRMKWLQNDAFKK